jgi:hypothetical protein
MPPKSSKSATRAAPVLAEGYTWTELHQDLS